MKLSKGFHRMSVQHQTETLNLLNSGLYVVNKQGGLIPTKKATTIQELTALAPDLTSMKMKG